MASQGDDGDPMARETEGREPLPTGPGQATRPPGHLRAAPGPEVSKEARRAAAPRRAEHWRRVFATEGGEARRGQA